MSLRRPPELWEEGGVLVGHLQERLLLLLVFVFAFSGSSPLSPLFTGVRILKTSPGMFGMFSVDPDSIAVLSDSSLFIAFDVLDSFGDRLTSSSGSSKMPLVGVSNLVVGDSSGS